jgi:hypothetical protein
MPKRGPLTVLNPVGPPLPLPPRKLGKVGTEPWNAIQAEYAIGDAGGVELLLQSCCALDEALAQRIAQDGIHTRTGMPKAHPGLKEELAARAFVCRNLERLGVTNESIQAVGRPGLALSWKPDP